MELSPKWARGPLIFKLVKKELNAYKRLSFSFFTGQNKPSKSVNTRQFTINLAKSFRHFVGICWFICMINLFI